MFGQHQESHILVVCLLLFALHPPGGELAAADVDEDFYQSPGVTTKQILEARGYEAEDFFIDSMSGEYKLKVTRGRNPLIRDGPIASKVPILFVHGILEDANIFVINSFGARPMDWSQLDLANRSIEQLNLELSLDPASKSLPLLALNCGHEVFILSRRGFPGSQNVGDGSRPISGHLANLRQLSKRAGLRAAPGDSVGRTNIGTGGAPRQSQGQKAWTDLLSLPGLNLLDPLQAYLATLLDTITSPEQTVISFSSSFYNFSLDEQALYDFPAALDFVLSETGRERAAVVAHSAGGAITLMSLSLYPEMADKISSAILWAEALNLGDGRIFSLVPLALPLLDIYVGSFPPSFIVNQLTATLALICSAPLADYTLCESVADALLGPSGFQQPLKPEYFSSILGPTSPHELAQVIRAASYPLGTMHKFDYRSRQRNELAYGQPSPPAYDLSKIRLSTMSFYAGATDEVVRPSDVARSIGLLSVPSRYHVVDTTFNHQGYFWHKNNSRLVVIPSLREIVTLGA